MFSQGCNPPANLPSSVTTHQYNNTQMIEIQNDSTSQKMLPKLVKQSPAKKKSVLPAA